MKLPTPMSLKEFPSLIYGDSALVFAALTSPDITPTDRVPLEIELEQEVEAVDYDAGAMIVRRFACFSSILSSSKTGRRSLLYAVPMIPQARWPGVRCHTRPAPAHQSLILGTDIFTTHHSASSRLQNLRWKCLQSRRNPTFTLTLTSHCRDRDDTEPGILTGKDILVQRKCSFFRIAVGKELSVTKEWGIFRCFSYPDSYHTTLPLREAGLLRVPLTLASRAKNTRLHHFTPYIDTALECEWAAIPTCRRYSAFLLFPLGYTSATITYLVQHPAPPMFSDEVQAHRNRSSTRKDESGSETRALQGQTSAHDESDDETVVETSSQYRTDVDGAREGVSMRGDD